MAARTFTTAGVNNLWSNPLNWDGGLTIPADNDSVTIPAGQTCEFDTDQSGFANGIDGITITGTLSLTRTTGTYYLKVKAGKTIAGAGTFDCGTLASPIPFAAKHAITGGAGWYIKGNDGAGLTMTVYAAEPTIKTVLLTLGESAGATVLRVDTDITGDIWADGDTIRIDNVNKGVNSEERVIATGGIAAGTITITAGLTGAKIAGTLVHLITRNVKIIGVGTNGHAIQNFASGKLVIAGGELRTANSNVLNACTGAIVSGGTFSGNSNALYICVGATVSGGTFSGNNTALSSCVGATVSGGTFSGNNTGLYICVGATVSGGTFSGNSTVLSNCTGATVSGGTFSGNNTGLQGCTGATVSGGTFSGNSTALNNCSATVKNASFTTSTHDIYESIVTCFYTLFGSTAENTKYTSMSKQAYSESIDHDQVAGAYKSWTKGGVTSSQASVLPAGYTTAMQTVLENATVEGYWQKEYTVGAGASIQFTANLRKAASMPYLPRCIIFNKASADPFAGGAGLHTFTMTDSIDTWEAESWTYTNATAADVTLVVRFQGMHATATFYSALLAEQINVDLTTALANIAAIKAKTDPITYTIANQIDANALSGGTDATQIRAAIGMNAANLDTQLSGIPAAVWAVATSTLTAAGTIGKYIMDLIAGVWAYVSRTLTQTSAQVQAAMTGSTLTITRGDTFTASLTGLGNISTRTKLYFTVKGNKSDTDAGAIIQLEETAGLTILNGAAYTTVTDGSIVVTDAATGALTITLKPDVTKTLAGNGLYYDLQIVTAAGVVKTITAATCNVVEDVTRAVS